MESLNVFRTALWGFAAMVDAGFAGLEFVFHRIGDAMEDGDLRPTMAAEVAEEARRLLGLDKPVKKTKTKNRRRH